MGIYGERVTKRYATVKLQDRLGGPAALVGTRGAPASLIAAATVLCALGLQAVLGFLDSRSVGMEDSRCGCPPCAVRAAVAGAMFLVSDRVGGREVKNLVEEGRSAWILQAPRFILQPVRLLGCAQVSFVLGWLGVTARSRHEEVLDSWFGDSPGGCPAAHLAGVPRWLLWSAGHALGHVRSMPLPFSCKGDLSC